MCVHPFRCVLWDVQEMQKNKRRKRLQTMRRNFL